MFSTYIRLCKTYTLRACPQCIGGRGGWRRFKGLFLAKSSWDSRSCISKCNSY